MPCSRIPADSFRVVSKHRRPAFLCQIDVKMRGSERREGGARLLDRGLVDKLAAATAVGDVLVGEGRRRKVGRAKVLVDDLRGDGGRVEQQRQKPGGKTKSARREYGGEERERERQEEGRWSRGITPRSDMSSLFPSLILPSRRSLRMRTKYAFWSFDILRHLQEKHVARSSL
jgi:hypothetical protein